MSSKLALTAILDQDNNDRKGNGKGIVSAAYDDEDNDSDDALSDVVAADSDSRLPGFCVECEDFCAVCFHAQHRKGTRRTHTHHILEESNSLDPAANSNSGIRPALSATAAIPTAKAATTPTTKTTTSATADSDDDSDYASSSDDGVDSSTEINKQGESGSTRMRGVTPTPPTTLPAPPTLDLSLTGTDSAKALVNGTVKAGDWYRERAKYIPLRLTLPERKFLRLLEAALNVSEYTDKIDILTYSSKSRRQVSQIQELCSIISGLVLAADYKIGQTLFKDKNFEDNEEFFRDIFELGRRHKIMNPEKMRNVYGKMIYILQDSQIPEVKELLSFSLVGSIKTVYRVLQDGDALELLNDNLIVPATKEILGTRDGGGSRLQVQKEIKAKERAIELLGKRYANSKLSADAIKQCLYSIGDNHAFLRTNRPDKADGQFSLSIQAGRGGARLSHDHKKQYNYVLQSLTLWREIMHDMFMLWGLAENDLLSDSNPYRLRDTGQGLNRMQAAPKTSRLMHNILHRAQQKVGYWVGSSVIHMGDTNVPNALMFIDKYTQIYRILLPIVRCLESIDDLAANNAGVSRYFNDTFGGPDALKMTIMSDFFRHAFDGSGADNFFSAGSCIDGRLTSAWNWCSTIEKKEYFHVFLLSGFVGFDGEHFS
ncbi:hypothetical protein HK100_000366 [Physocladia obscura]|uniref:Non-canonical E2 ubiquitin-conjugating enzyme C-terminal domain-containing protein n=1 Tax=Physocladia obscura TaxID=109957 RepID=A0AAD5SZZ6_9FUNG|nr:hypothetical protein HK100_000366 [Physocladia obscura]